MMISSVLNTLFIQYEKNNGFLYRLLDGFIFIVYTEYINYKNKKYYGYN